VPWAPLTSFVGREREAAELAGLLRDHRLVTVTGPGGVGKTRLAAEVARAAAGQFPDGVHFAGLGAVSDPARVPSAVAAALGVRPAPGRPAREAVAGLLAPRRLLLVLDNCEHVLEAAAELCGELLKVADDVRLLATSREPLRVGGEVRYRLPPLELPGSDDPAQIGRSEAVALFAERARHADPQFALGDGDAPLAARVVGRLDGMPLAIELAAARVEALGLAGLADRVDDALRLLEDRGVLAAARHRSLAAVADWSYRLLSAAERGVFRRLAVFPGPFTLEGAEAVAGPEAGPVVLRLVDCSLVAPPRRGPDGRMRYALLQTLRAFGLARLAEAGGEREAAAALAGFALSVAGQAGAGLQAGGQDGELAALRWLDAEDATLGRALGWALEDDPGAALALATALAPWWLQRGRMGEGYAQLAAAAARAAPGGAGRACIPGNHSSEYSRRRECLRRIEGVLEPAQVRDAEARGARMTLAAATEFAAMLTAPRETAPELADGLTGRERELVTLVAQGATNAEIAAKLFISVRTVSSHLDRIRDKTGCRRRADLTRLALRDGLI